MLATQSRLRATTFILQQNPLGGMLLVRAIVLYIFTPHALHLSFIFMFLSSCIRFRIIFIFIIYNNNNLAKQSEKPILRKVKLELYFFFIKKIRLISCSQASLVPTRRSSVRLIPNDSRDHVYMTSIRGNKEREIFCMIPSNVFTMAATTESSAAESSFR